MGKEVQNERGTMWLSMTSWGPMIEQLHSSTHSWPWCWVEVSCVLRAPGVLSPRKGLEVHRGYVSQPFSISCAHNIMLLLPATEPWSLGYPAHSPDTIPTVLFRLLAAGEISCPITWGQNKIPTALDMLSKVGRYFSSQLAANFGIQII